MCATWFPSRFSPSLGFYIPTRGVRVLGVPLGSFSFIFSFFKEALDDDVQHIDALPRLGDV